MRKLRIGHVGTLHDHSSAKLSCILKFPEIFEPVGVVAESPEREAQLSAVEPYASVGFVSRERLLAAKPDAVLVEGFETELVREARFWAENGVHIHLDKPAGASLGDFEALLNTARANRLVVQTAYMYRYNPAVLDCLARVRAGELGEVFEVDAVMNTCHPPEKRRWLNNFPGGIMFFLGCHMVDLVYLFAGAPERVTPYIKYTEIDGTHAPDHALAVFEYKNGVSTVRATSTEVNGYGRRQLIVCGSLGTYEILPLENPMKAYFTPKSRSATFADRREPVELEPLLPECRYDRMMLDFAAFVRGERENPFTPEYELEMHSLLMRCCGIGADTLPGGVVTPEAPLNPKK